MSSGRVPWLPQGQKYKAPARVGDSRHLEHEAPVVAMDSGPFDLHHANASRYGAWQHLGLLEDHIISAPCPNCMAKHLGRAIAYLHEARTLEDGDASDVAVAGKLEGMLREILASKSTEPKLDLDTARALRLVVQERIGL